MDSYVESNNAEVSARRVKMCTTLSEAVKEHTAVTAVILTYGLQGSEKITSYALAFTDIGKDGFNAVDYINNHSLDDTKPISAKKRKSKEIKQESHTLASYFKKNAGNPLVENERIFLEAAGYDINKGYYTTIPIQDKVLGKGICFVFTRNLREKTSLQKDLPISL